MKNFTRKIAVLVFAFAVVGGYFGIATEAKTRSLVKKPTVVVIRADWCRACQKVEPIVSGLKKDYGRKLNFVILDVTDEAAEAKSRRRAKSIGLGRFFNTNKKKTSTVAIFSGNKKVFHTVKNYRRTAYVNAFEKALK